MGDGLAGSPSETSLSGVELSGSKVRLVAQALHTKLTFGRGTKYVHPHVLQKVAQVFDTVLEQLSPYFEEERAFTSTFFGIDELSKEAEKEQRHYGNGVPVCRAPSVVEK